MTNYDKLFDNMGKSIAEGFSLTEADAIKASSPKSLDIGSDKLTVADSFKHGTIAGRPSERLLDKKDHFPVITQTQAQSSMNRVMQLVEVPNWYRGDLDELRLEVYNGIASVHEDIELNVKVAAEQALALSDGHSEPASNKGDIKDPCEEIGHKHPGIKNAKRPTITSAEYIELCQDEEFRKTEASRLMEMLEGQVEAAQKAKKLASKLMKGGLTGEEFAALEVYTQQDIMYAQMKKETASASSRRKELLEKMKNKKKSDDC